VPTLGGATGGAHRVRRPAATAHNLDSSKIVAPRAFRVALHFPRRWHMSCAMAGKHRTRMCINGRGSAGLLLSDLPALGGVDSIVVESHSRAYSEDLQRAGMLE
jgi:hypothetical protein